MNRIQFQRGMSLSEFFERFNTEAQCGGKWGKLKCPRHLNHESKRRIEVVGIFPNEAAIRRLVGAILCEQTDEWIVQRARYMPRDTMSEVLDHPVTDLPAVAN